MPLIAVFLSLSILAGLVFSFWRLMVKTSAQNKIFWPALIFKLTCGILLGLFYAGGFDTFTYQGISESFTTLGRADFNAYLQLLFYNEIPEVITPHLTHIKPYSNSFFFIKILSLLNFLTGQNYYLNGLFLSFFSFAGCWYLIRIISEVFPGAAKAAIIAFIFFPSVVFWNSGVTKETVLMGSLCFFWATVLKTVYFPGKKVWLNLVIMVVAAWLLWKIKYFLAVFVYGFTAVWLVLHWLRQRFALLRSKAALLISLPVITIMIAAALRFLHYQFEPGFFLRHLIKNYQSLQAGSHGKPSIVLEGLEPNFGNVLMHTPEAFFSALFRPFFWEGRNIWYKIAGAENIVILLIFLGGLAGLLPIRKKKMRGFYLVLLAYALILTAIFGLTTPNLGSLNRYRTATLPFLLYLLLQSPFWQNLLNRLRIKKPSGPA